jgi:MFS family permease
MNHRQVLEALSGLLLGMFVSMLASTVVSSSLPVIIHDLDGNQAAFTWVVTATLLTTAISTPDLGQARRPHESQGALPARDRDLRARDRGGRLLETPEMLIAFRAVQGIGAGGLAALSQVLMADIISPRERGRYMGLFGAVMALATIGGPLLGGVITDAWGWRWNFFVALPVAVVALILVQATLHVPARPKKTTIDYLGIVLLSAAVSLLLIWVTNAGTTTTGDWGTSRTTTTGGA